MTSLANRPAAITHVPKNVRILSKNAGANFPCPKCKSGGMPVSDARPCDEGFRRRHVCQSCGFRLTTYERASHEEDDPRIVELRDKLRELQDLLDAMPVRLEWNDL